MSRRLVTRRPCQETAFPRGGPFACPPTARGRRITRTPTAIEGRVMSEQPSGSTGPGGDQQRDTRSDVDDLHVTPNVPGPSGTGEDTDRGGDPDAETQIEGKPG